MAPRAVASAPGRAAVEECVTEMLEVTEALGDVQVEWIRVNFSE